MKFVTVTVLAAAALLAGCDSAERDRLRARTEILSEMVEKQYGKRQAELAQLAQQAAITEACRAVVNICPASVTAPGAAAIDGVASEFGKNRTLSRSARWKRSGVRLEVSG
jgi:hypothetical protein